MNIRSRKFLCAVLMALLAVLANARAAVIIDQSSGATGAVVGSQDFPDFPAYSQSAFDDFTISSAFNVTSLTVFGREFGRPSANVNVVAGIYASPDLTTHPLLSTSGVQSGADLFFDFGGVTLAAGTYWVSAYVVRPDAAGEWSWNVRLPIGGSQARWHNPGGGFGFGTSPVPLGDVLEEADLMFILRGDPAVGPRLNVARSSPGFRLSWTTNAVAYRLA
jgi:hypothetical protein